MNEEQLREAYPFLYAKQKNREQANELIDKRFFGIQFGEVNKVDSPGANNEINLNNNDGPLEDDKASGTQELTSRGEAVNFITNFTSMRKTLIASSIESL